MINSSILDVETKIDEFCFVVGLEILDNMPHVSTIRLNHSLD